MRNKGQTKRTFVTVSKQVGSNTIWCSNFIQSTTHMLKNSFHTGKVLQEIPDMTTEKIENHKTQPPKSFETLKNMRCCCCMDFYLGGTLYYTLLT